MHPTRPSKKEITCYYWNSGKCKYTADSCLYAHSITGRVAEQPTRSSGSETKPDRNNIVDLISLVDCDDIVAPTATSTKARSFSSNDSSGFGSSDELDYPKLTKTVSKAVQSGRSYDYIQSMLDKHTSQSIKEALSETKDGDSAIFAAVKRGATDIINLLVEKGANPNATESRSGVPLLAFAILQDSDITVVQTLLSLGADPLSIPRDIWDPEAAYKDSSSWCSNSQRVSLLTRMNSHLQYHLQTSYELVPPTQNNRKVARLLGTKALLHAPYTMVGRAQAISKVENYMMSHLMFPADRPLVLAFVGPPNHGQAELAAKIGTMGSLKRIVERAKAVSKRINIDHIPGDTSSHELEVVYIDNLDKIGLSNLITLLDGHPQGPKSNTAIDNSKIIYVLSVTDGENTIIDFHNKYFAEGVRSDLAPWGKLETDLKNDLVKSYGTLLTSNIDAIIPFLPYKKRETIALASKYIHDVRSRLAVSSAPALLSRNTTKARFTLDLELDDEPQICSTIADHYDKALGARSIQQEVVKKIQVAVAKLYARHSASLDTAAEHGVVDDVFGGEAQGVVQKVRAKVMVKRGRGQWGKDGRYVSVSLQ